MKKMILVTLIAMTGVFELIYCKKKFELNIYENLSGCKVIQFKHPEIEKIKIVTLFPKNWINANSKRLQLAEYFVPTIKRLFKNEKDRFNMKRFMESVDQTNIYNSYVGDVNRKNFNSVSAYFIAQRNSGVWDAIFQYDEKVLSKLVEENKITWRDYWRKDSLENKPVDNQFRQKQGKKLGYVGGNKLPNPGMFSTLGRVSQDIMKNSFAKITAICEYFRK